MSLSLYQFEIHQAAQLIQESESPRVWWRLQHLREWSHEEETESIYTGRS